MFLDYELSEHFYNYNNITSCMRTECIHCSSSIIVLRNMISDEAGQHLTNYPRSLLIIQSFDWNWRAAILFINLIMAAHRMEYLHE